jgi:RNA 2',3'-cyclic 3'-phosphodiesterase
LSAPRSRENRARLFFALWPDDVVRGTLATAARDVQAQTGGRAIPSDKIHLTLYFVGSIDRGRMSALEAIGASMRSRAFELALDTLGYWRHNRIVWCGTTRCPPALTALAADLHTALAHDGVRAEERPYAPHVTLVRDAARAPRDAAFARCAWQVREFVLVESEPLEGAMRYAVRARWPL